MLGKNQGIRVSSILLLLAFIISACEQPYSTPPAVTNTPIASNNFFSSPIPQSGDSMNSVELFGTQTALAAQGNIDIPTATSGAVENSDQPTVTATPLVQLNPTNTATLAVSNTVNTPVPSGSNPSTYILKSGEFPYCIARRFNVDPDQLLSLSGLSSADALSLVAGTVLTIPQNSTFPGTRALSPHPASYTVVSSDETLYSVACKYGDISPSAIASNNNISVEADLTAGQILNIP